MNDQNGNPGHIQSDRKLAALATGLLSEDEAQRIRAHLATCGDCRQYWQEFLAQRDHEAAEERHLPAAMIARWDRAQESLRGLERTLVRQHLEHCEQCRAELQALGFEPSMPDATVTTLEPRAPSRSAEGHLTERWQWFAGGVGLAAAAAVTVFMLLPSVPEKTTDLSPGVVPWVAPTRLRSATGEVLTVTPGTATVTILVGTPYGTDTSQPATLEVLSPSDDPILQTTLPPADLQRQTLVVLLRHTEPLPEGTYQVVVRQEISGTTAVEDISTFVLRIQGP